MGITIFYKGAVADVERIEDLEDRVLDVALDLGANAQFFRSSSDVAPERCVRGLIVDLAPGQETTSLLFSPEGWLISLMDIEDAENGCLPEPPSCFVKTQFGSVEGHVALVELLSALKKQYIPNLEVSDEGGYWESRDLNVLREKFTFLQGAIEGMKEGLEQHGLSAEAAEDPEILRTRIERIAAQVQQTLSRPSEHPPVRFAEFDDDDPLCDEDRMGTEQQWDGSFKENRRKQERIARAIEERLQRGEDYDEAFENALNDVGIVGLPDESSNSEDDERIGEELFDEELFDDELIDESPEEPWKESLPEAVRDQDEDDGLFDQRHPLQERGTDLMMRLHDISKELETPRNGHIDVLLRGAGDIMGGLAQALSGPEDTMYGLSVVQLKRALRGAAFARGALFPLRSEGAIDQTVYDELRGTLEDFQTEILGELKRLRSEWKQTE